MEERTGTILTGRELQRYERHKARVDGGFWAKVRHNLGRVPFLEEILAAYYCAVDGSTPLRVKAVLMAALAYFVLPTDMIPDFIAGLGFTDDVTVLLAAVSTVRPHIGDDHRARAKSALKRERSGNETEDET